MSEQTPTPIPPQAPHPLPRLSMLMAQLDTEPSGLLGVTSKYGDRHIGARSAAPAPAATFDAEDEQRIQNIVRSGEETRALARGADDTASQALREVQQLADKVEPFMETHGDEVVPTLTEWNELVSRVNEVDEWMHQQQSAAPDNGKHGAFLGGYVFHPAAELKWFLSTGIGTILIESLAHPEAIKDWRAWAIGVGAASVRAILGALQAAASAAPSEPVPAQNRSTEPPQAFKDY